MIGKNGWLSLNTIVDSSLCFLRAGEGMEGMD